MKLENNIPLLHPTQQRILNHFRQTTENSFNEMKTFRIDPKNFVYHLNKLIEYGLLSYENKKYRITDFGKLFFMHFKSGSTIDKITVNTFVGLYVTNSENKILVVKRDRNPYLHYIGIPTLGASIDTLLEDTAKKLTEDINISGELRRALIIETIYKNNDNISLTHSNMHIFTLSNQNIESIKEKSREGELYWMSPTELLTQEKGYKDSESIIDYFRKKHSKIGYITRIDKESGI